MPDHILFLDFDGVLHPNLCEPSAWFSRMSFLEEALVNADVRVVISSSWRFHHSYAALARRFPVNLRLLLDGTTGEAFVGTHARFREITAWLAQYGAGSAGTHWRALDDAAFEFPKECPALIHCDGATGMTAEDVLVVQQWLASSRNR